ncbi:MAG TPA: lipoate--protein ligase family protein [Terriglobales bacterium]|nr:lipoate--protein ligase family protein [Terriglobales bacterium]
MKYLELTFADPASNLACDESLIELLEETNSEDGILRLWEPSSYFVVLGYANKLLSEVDGPACLRHGIPVLRRFSGGGTVLQGPGCVNYSVILPTRSPALDTIKGAYRFVLERHQRCVENLLGTPVEIRGVSDLAIHGKKFSGNAQNRKRHFVLLHGTFLLDLDLGLVQTCLRMPAKQPRYRQSRRHEDFLRNLQLETETISKSLKATWGAMSEFVDVPVARIEELVEERYGCRDWTCRF